MGEDPEERIELVDPVFEGDSVLVGTRVEGGSEVRIPLEEVEGLQGHFFSFGQTLFLGVVSGAELTVGFLAAPATRADGATVRILARRAERRTRRASGRKAGSGSPEEARMIARVTLGCLALVAVASCGGASDAEADGALILEAADVRILGSSESIAEVRDLALADDGSVWVLNSVEPLFVGFAPDGSIVRAHGASGGGPEEFPMPAGFVGGGLDGQVWVFDAARHTLIRVSGPEGAWEERPIPRDDLPPGTVLGGIDLLSTDVRTERMGDEIILPHTSATLQLGLLPFILRLLGADLVAFDPAADSVRELAALGELLADPSDGFADTEGGFPLWRRLWAVCGEDRLRAFDRAANQLRGVDASGRALEPVALPPWTRTEATRREFAEAVFPMRSAEVVGRAGSRLGPGDSARVMDGILQGITGGPEELATYLPRYLDLRCSPAGVLWLQPYDPEDGGMAGASTWLRVAGSGAVDRVRFPDRFDPIRFRDDRVWGVQRDELDVASVAWIGLTAAGR